MNYISFTDVKNKLNLEEEVVKYHDIEILKYLSIEDKNSIIQLALQNSEESGIYNLLKLNMYFELYIIYSYTNINFSMEEKSNPVEIYDILKSNGLIDTIINSIPEKEYAYLKTTLKDTMELKIKYRNTIAAVLNSFIENLPKNAEEAMKTINTFNPEDFQKVIDFANAANGGRPID